MDDRKEIRWHGRGGQGVVVAAKILTTAFDREGKSAMAFPKFGFERRGAPVIAFNRFANQTIREKTQIYHPDCVVVIDPYLMLTVDVFEGIKPNSVLVVDAPQPVEKQLHENLKIIGSVDATGIALAEIGKPISNSSMLGAFARTTGWVSIDHVLSSIGEYFTGDVLKKNLQCAQRGYEETTTRRF